MTRGRILEGDIGLALEEVYREWVNGRWILTVDDICIGGVNEKGKSEVIDEEKV